MVDVIPSFGHHIGNKFVDRRDWVVGVADFSTRSCRCWRELRIWCRRSWYLAFSNLFRRFHGLVRLDGLPGVGQRSTGFVNLKKVATTVTIWILDKSGIKVDKSDTKRNVYVLWQTGIIFPNIEKSPLFLLYFSPMAYRLGLANWRAG